jgi:S1-C subfamily serine protease
MAFSFLINLVIIFLALTSIVRGYEIGWLRQFFSTVGFFGGLFLGALIGPIFVNLAHTTLSRTIITLVFTLGLAFCLLLAGETIGLYLKKRVHIKKLNTIDNFLGSIISLVTMLFSIWICAAIISSLMIPGLQSTINSTALVQDLNKALPNAPSVVSRLGSLVDPNGFPEVFIGGEPAPDKNAALPNLGSLNNAINADKNSVVKIQGLGCGGIVDGSGFVIGSDLVATNAHVIAGISHPSVIDSNGTHSAVPIWFDPNLDFAVLAVPNLAGNPLVIDSNIASNGTAAAVLGYPGGGPFTVKPADVLEEFSAVGRNIYGKNTTTRSVYELKADVIPGNSGGPLIEANGDVIGIVFAESTTYNQVGYALTANQITSAIKQAEAQNYAVSTGSCAE